MWEAVQPSAHDTLGTGRGTPLWVTQHPSREPCRIVSSSSGHSRNPHKGLKIYQFLGVGDPVHDLKTSLGEITRKHIPQPKNSLGFPSSEKERLLPALLGAGLPCMLVYWIWQHKDNVCVGGSINVISFSFLPVCIGFAVRQSYACPRFPVSKISVSTICWDLRGKNPTPSSHYSIDFIPTPPLPSSVRRWVGGAGPVERAPPMRALARGEGLPPTPLCHSPLSPAPTPPASQIHWLGQEKAKKTHPKTWRKKPKTWKKQKWELFSAGFPSQTGFQGDWWVPSHGGSIGRKCPSWHRWGLRLVPTFCLTPLRHLIFSQTEIHPWHRTIEQGTIPAPSQPAAGTGAKSQDSRRHQREGGEGKSGWRGLDHPLSAGWHHG